VVSCYSLSLCQASSTDQETNNISVFGLIEAVAAPLSDLRGVLPWEGHAYFEQPERLHRHIDVRLLWIRDATKEEAPAQQFDGVEVDSRRVRVRFRGVQGPPWNGYLHIAVEWRDAGSEEHWHREPHRWPVEIVDAPATFKLSVNPQRPVG
jgi:hypothetical protein